MYNTIFIGSLLAIGLYKWLGPEQFVATVLPAVLLAPVATVMALYAAYRVGCWTLNNIHLIHDGSWGSEPGAMMGPLIIAFIASIPTFIGVFWLIEHYGIALLK